MELENNSTGTINYFFVIFLIAHCSTSFPGSLFSMFMAFSYVATAISNPVRFRAESTFEYRRIQMG